jgi:uncharacterized protein (DUF1330 family)
MTKAYLLWEMDVHDPVGYADYRDAAGPLMERAGGRTVAGVKRRKTLEGDATPANLYVVEFPSYDAALEWFDSPEYRAVAPIRHATSTSRILLVEAEQ